MRDNYGDCWTYPIAKIKEMINGFVSSSRKINGKPLTEDITLTPADLNAVPDTRKVNGKALSSDITLTAEDVGANPSNLTIYTLPSENITGASAGTVEIIACGRICICRFTGSLIANGGSGWTEIFKFPTEYRPNYALNFLINNDTKGAVGFSSEARISYDNSNFQIYNPVQDNAYWGSFVYFR